MKKLFITLFLVLFLFGITGCHKTSEKNDSINKDQNNEIIDSNEETTEKQKGILYKYDIEDIKYSELKGSIYINDDNNNLVKFYDVGLMKDGKTDFECNLTFYNDNALYKTKDDKYKSNCTYDENDTFDGFELNIFSVAESSNKGSYYRSMRIKMKYNNNESMVTFKLKDGKELKAYNSYYLKFKELNIKEVLHDKDTNEFYDINGNPIHNDCYDIEICVSNNNSGIDINDYEIIDSGNEGKTYPEITYLEDMFISTYYYIKFFKNNTCEIDGNPPPYYAKHYFESCSYSIKPKGDNYIVTVSVSFYWDIDHNLEYYTIPFGGYVKDGKIKNLIDDSYTGTTVFQDIKNYTGHFVMSCVE